MGMSGSGKTYWSIKLAACGFRRFCCDDMIAEKLATDLTRPDGNILELGEWMKFPYEPEHKERASKYLSYEAETLNEIINTIESQKDNPEKKIVVDTTGSVIYTSRKALEKLCDLTTVVYLSIPPEVQERMLKAYVAESRPVLWRDAFHKEPEENNEEALRRCYPILLFARERLYERYADVTIDYYRRNEKGFGLSDLLNEVHVRESQTHQPQIE